METSSPTAEQPLHRDHSKACKCYFAALILLIHTCALKRLRFVFTSQHAKTNRKTTVNRKVHQATRGFLTDKVIMTRLTPQDTAERDKAIKFLAAIPA